MEIEVLKNCWKCNAEMMPYFCRNDIGDFIRAWWVCPRRCSSNAEVEFKLKTSSVRDHNGHRMESDDGLRTLGSGYWDLVNPLPNLKFSEPPSWRGEVEVVLKWILRNLRKENLNHLNGGDNEKL